MPVTPLIKASTKVTPGQWKRLLRRVLIDEPIAAKRGLLPERIAQETGEVGSLSPRAINEIMQTEPQVTREMGALTGPHPNPSLAEAGERTVENLPLAEARAKYFANPERYSAGGYRPPVKELSMAPVESPLPEDLASAISYQRTQFKPVVPPSISRAAASMKRGIAAEEAEEQLLSRGLRPEDVRTSPEKYLSTEHGVGKEDLGAKALREVLGNALEADQIWREMAGGFGTPEAEQLMKSQTVRARTPQTMATALWGRLLDLQSSGVKQAFKNPKDWFMASYNKWKKNPAEFGKKHPREASLLSRIKQVYEGGGE